MIYNQYLFNINNVESFNYKRGHNIIYEQKKKTPILYWFLCLINFSVEKLIVYFVVECLNCEIKNLWTFNFIGIYKGKGVF